MYSITEPQQVLGRTVKSADGGKIGSAGQVYVDDQSGRLEWITVNTGLFGTKESFVPLRDATVQGDDLVVPYDKDRVKNAPQGDQDGDGHLSAEGEDELYRYYGITADYDTTTTGTAGYTEGTVGTTAGLGTDSGTDVSGPETDNAMTRSEERIRVGTERVQTGRARLRKYVTTETVHQEVPVSRERLVVEREPITEANIGNATSGPDISEEEHEITLSEERPVVAKETVPVERVRVDKEVETTTVGVDETVRKENIDLDEGTGVTDTRR